ncbi:RNA-directed DNA polymerase, eukaryota, reverse transcriptase zinc-binding domain protein [Tanacetum coccineum]
MDQITTNMCKVGTSRLGFARVLIEVEASKGLPDMIKIVYKYKHNMVIGKKIVKVEYDWAPLICSFCSVFGHGIKNCSCRPKTAKEVKEITKAEAKKKVETNDFVEDTGSPIKAVMKVHIRKEMGTIEEDNDIFEEVTGSASKMAQKELHSSYATAWNVRGLGKKIKQNAVKYLIHVEKLSICACNRGCRIMIGWDSDKIQCTVIHASDQAVLCLVEVISTKEKLLCTFIYAENDGRLKRKLWADLNVYKSICSSNPWVMMGDLNDYVNAIKVEDVCSTRLHYTWTKSLLNPNTSVLKNIDRVMGNEDFFEAHSMAHVMYLPYEFAMFKLVKKLKAIKPIMNKLNWQNGNLTEKVKRLKKNLDEVQMMIDKDPHNGLLREQGVVILKEYTTTLEDKEKLLFQRAKVDWLNDGDRNSAFFTKFSKEG